MQGETRMNNKTLSLTSLLLNCGKAAVRKAAADYERSHHLAFVGSKTNRR
jgi:hypothetical protein